MKLSEKDKQQLAEAFAEPKEPVKIDMDLLIQKIKESRRLRKMNLDELITFIEKNYLDIMEDFYQSFKSSCKKDSSKEFSFEPLKTLNKFHAQIGGKTIDEIDPRAVAAFTDLINLIYKNMNAFEALHKGGYLSIIFGNDN